MFEQAALAATLLHGPAYLPPGLFAGSDAAVLRGLRVHANTISHARLIALEETFPRTRAYLGDAEFNRLSRAYLEAGGAQRRALAEIGAGFPASLVDPLAADLACIERAWLDSYHAAEAPALALADLGGLEQGDLLDLAVRCHPATHMLTLASDAAQLLDAGFASGVRALLVTRPDADVRLLAIEAADVAAIVIAQEICPLGNLIAHLAEHHPGGGAAVTALIGVGAFERVER